MLRIQTRTGIIIAESIFIIILSVSLGWYYYHVQNSLQHRHVHSLIFQPVPNVKPDRTVPCPSKNDEQLPGNVLRSMFQVDRPEHHWTQTSPDVQRTSSDEHDHHQQRRLPSIVSKACNTRI